MPLDCTYEETKEKIKSREEIIKIKSQELLSENSKENYKKTILVGSTYFFKDIEGFNSKDVDYLILENRPKEYKTNYQLTGKGQCLFKWKKMSVSEYISLALETKCPMEVGKFLVKEVAYSIGMKIEDLEKLAPVFEKLDDKHKYEKVIYDSYIENNKYYLTDEQRMRAYEVYKEFRQ